MDLQQLIEFLLATFVLSPLSSYAVFHMLVKPAEQDSARLLSITVPFGPCLISLILFWLMYGFPGNSTSFYIFSTCTALVAPLGYFFVHPQSLTRPFKDILSLILQSKVMLILLIIAFFLFFSLLLITLLTPVYANDPLQYFLEARYLLHEKDSSLYPFTQYVTGFYSQTRHPPFYSMLLTWSMLFIKNPHLTLLGRIIAPFYVLYGSLVFLVFPKEKPRELWVVAALATFGTPLVYALCAVSHIDVFRMTTYLAAACWVYWCATRGNVRHAIATGLAVGLAMRVHTSAILLVPFLGLSFLILSKDSWKNRLLLSFVMIASMLTICGFDYIRNILIYGNLVSGTEEALKIYSINGLNYDEYILISRDMNTLPTLLMNGMFAGLFNIDKFGLEYWFALYAFYKIVVSRKFSDLELVFLFQIALYYLMVVISVVLGMNFTVKNYRYSLMVHPFVAYFSAVGIYEIYKKITDN